MLILEVESNLPENIKDRAVSVFKSAVSQGYPIIAAVEKVQNEALSEIETVFKGQRFKVRKCNILCLVPGLSFPGCRGT